MHNIHSMHNLHSMHNIHSKQMIPLRIKLILRFHHEFSTFLIHLLTKESQQL
ncbi:hypothetical protein BDB01DRAFT_802885 [Pilobolus umbonatus]|nr:hypothetical protein BDB01DRAFT_802885 [Pilobolus umbonatus]